MNESPELDYHALCVDTNIFREAGYGLDRGLLAQLDQFTQSPVQVVISEIVAREMQRQIAELVGKARAALEKSLKDVQLEMLTSEGSAHRARRAILTGETDEQIAQRRLDQFYERCDAMVLPADTVSSRDVLDRYFNREPPFAAPGDKKQEFPDAYALMSVERWAEEKNFKVIVVSRDRDWREFCASSERLVHRAELGEALKLLQPHNAAARLLTELNDCLVGEGDGYGIVESIRESIKGSVEAMEIDVQADSHFYCEASEVYAEYRDHEFRRITDEQVDMDLVRVTEHQVVVRLTAAITCGVHASFALSMTDPIDKEEVSMGSQSVEIEQTFDSDVLVSFEGDFAEGLASVLVNSVELVDEMPTVEFGEIEMNGGREDEEYDQEDGISSGE
jgi:hypothetical protein